MISIRVKIPFLTHRKKIILVVKRVVNYYLPELFIKKWRSSFFYLTGEPMRNSGVACAPFRFLTPFSFVFLG